MWTQESQVAMVLVRLGLQCYNLHAYISWETEFRKVLLVRAAVIAIYRFSSKQRLTVHLVTHICENLTKAYRGHMAARRSMNNSKIR